MDPLVCAFRDASDLGDIRTKINKQKKWKKHTFDHLAGRDGIRSTLEVTGCVIEQEKALGAAICFALEDVNHAFDLAHKHVCVEVTIAVLPWFEHDAGLSEVTVKLRVQKEKKRKLHTCYHNAGIPTRPLRNLRPLATAPRLSVWELVGYLDGSNLSSFRRFGRKPIHRA